MSSNVGQGVGKPVGKPVGPGDGRSVGDVDGFRLKVGIPEGADVGGLVSFAVVIVLVSTETAIDSKVSTFCSNEGDDNPLLMALVISSVDEVELVSSKEIDHV